MGKRSQQEEPLFSLLRSSFAFVLIIALAAALVAIAPSTV